MTVSLEAYVAASRFGLGARPGELGDIGRDPRGWILQQIAHPHEVPRALCGFPPSADILRAIHEARLEGRRELRHVIRRGIRRLLFREIAARSAAMVQSPQSFRERMVVFWSNHFTVSFTRRIIGPTIAAYEREAIRPHVFGRFEDMILAVIHHPSMLSYLDNSRSVGPNSIGGLWRGRGLNENLAREILELHTLGVTGGYTQRDVGELAKILTGWAHGGNRSRRSVARFGPVHGAFEFRDRRHEPGAKLLLGKRYREDGEQEGIEALGDLVRHPSTARMIATKLARHFIADDPPEDSVRRLERAFRESDGDLAEVCRALVGLDAAWQRQPAKFKTPYELVISTLRAAGLDDLPRRELLNGFRQLGHFPFRAPSPAGWPDRARDWISPESVMRRIEWVRVVAARLPPSLRPGEVARETIGPVMSRRTRAMIDTADSKEEALAMLFASPEFQKR